MIRRRINLYYIHHMMTTICDVKRRKNVSFYSMVFHIFFARFSQTFIYKGHDLSDHPSIVVYYKQHMMTSMKHFFCFRYRFSLFFYLMNVLLVRNVSVFIPFFTNNQWKLDGQQVQQFYFVSDLKMSSRKRNLTKRKTTGTKESLLKERI